MLRSEICFALPEGWFLQIVQSVVFPLLVACPTPSCSQRYLEPRKLWEKNRAPVDRPAYDGITIGASVRVAAHGWTLDGCLEYFMGINTLYNLGRVRKAFDVEGLGEFSTSLWLLLRMVHRVRHRYSSRRTRKWIHQGGEEERQPLPQFVHLSVKLYMVQNSQETWEKPIETI